MATTTLRSQNDALRSQNDTLQRQLADAVERISQQELAEMKANGDGLFQKVVEDLVGMGVPGLVLLVAVSVSGFAGAAALTAALASLGGPFGMIGGIAVLLLLFRASTALTQYGLPKVAKAVVQGLIAKGESPETVRKGIDSIPKWVISTELRASVDEALTEATRPG